ncbi:MAG TPA: heme lyase CcmF/NrfE family subunit [Acidimicrobiales bacterium]|nr:heme lyase CcmF/NrfE family subunit [Acidimicrobiales bacterium]
MNSALGHSGVLLAFCSAIAGVATVVTGVVRGRPHLMKAGRAYVLMVLGGVVFAVGAMEHALLTNDFSLVYLAENSARSTPLVYKVATLWAALEGSILLWGLILSGYLTSMVWRFRHRLQEPHVAWAIVVGLGIAAFFFGLMVGPADPFRSVSGTIPFDGPGPNPLLQNHPLMAFHPPVLYLGYVGFTVPFSFAIGSLITGNFAAAWVQETRRWSLVAWGFLTVGIGAGAWWSYEVLGWGGYWAWDPVENASFLPWLTATAYLHSVLVQQRRGALRVWNVSLVVATFSLTILGTFLTRSGVLDSVHAFTESVVGPALLALLGVVVVGALGLIAWRGDSLRTRTSPAAAVSREGLFLANNLAFSAFAFVVLLGTVFPLLAEALSGDRISVGRPYFDRMTSPLALALLFLMAVAPVLSWSRDSSKLIGERLLVPAAGSVAVLVACVGFGMRSLGALAAFSLAAFAAGTAARQLVVGVRRRGWRGLTGGSGGGMVAHIGFVVVALAVAGSSSFTEKADLHLSPGESAMVSGHSVEYVGSRTVPHPNRISEVAEVRIDGGRLYRPALSRFPFATQAIGTPSVKTGWREDVYLTLVATPGEGEDEVVLGVRIIPLALWLWSGVGLMGLGTALALVGPRRRRAPDAAIDAPVREPVVSAEDGSKPELVAAPS